MDHITLPYLMGALEAVYHNLRTPDILPFSFNLHGYMSQDEWDSAQAWVFSCAVVDVLTRG